MDKPIFNILKESLKEAAAISKGEAEPARRIAYTDEEVKAIKEGRGQEVKAARMAQEVKAIRERLELSQTAFAKLIQVNVRTLQNWEQGHRHPPSFRTRRCRLWSTFCLTSLPRLWQAL